MPVEMTTEQAEMIQNAYHLWLTTVRADGMPQPTPIWFVWENDSVLLYSKPDAQKVRNIRQNPKVALSFNRDTEAEEFVVIMVKDTGIGIPKESIYSIFDSFTQASSDTTRKFGGTGLGLTISRRLAQLLGGDIVVTSEAGVGSISEIFDAEDPHAPGGCIAQAWSVAEVLRSIVSLKDLEDEVIATAAQKEERQ